MFIFNLKAKLIIKTITFNKEKKKKGSVQHMFLSKQMESPIGIGNKRAKKKSENKTEKNNLKKKTK